MMTSLVFLVPILVGVTAGPFQQSPDNRLSKRNEGSFPLTSETLTTDNNNNNDDNEGDESKPKKYFEQDITKDSSSTLSSFLNKYQRNEGKTEEENEEKVKDKVTKKNRKHKAIFMDYPLISRLRQTYPNSPNNDIGYNYIYDPNVEERTSSNTDEKYQESNIFYIRLPPTPYMFVPGLGYISQPPTYSTANLRPHIPQSKPSRPQVQTYQRPNPFIKLPIDFVSNGKPTSVYHWQKKKPLTNVKLTTDSPITNLDNLKPGFVNNGKPTTIYQWHTNLKLGKRPDDYVNNLDKGPYLFNGKPTSLYLLKSDGTSSGHRPIRYSSFENDNAY
ncbi:PREDICTED: protein NRDE2 homolog [Polistes dominula]|uniref:Protein NRDE2 homolog n=1 Tax=Polistes dominula TaxID=743375 RepID=A0ABM1INV2_POLDO|nr:PREDICTED: protein NRDE2 homolog [Polistes dominula]